MQFEEIEESNPWANHGCGRGKWSPTRGRFKHDTEANGMGTPVLGGYATRNAMAVVVTAEEGGRG